MLEPTLFHVILICSKKSSSSIASAQTDNGENNTVTAYPNSFKAIASFFMRGFAEGCAEVTIKIFFKYVELKSQNINIKNEKVILPIYRITNRF